MYIASNKQTAETGVAVCRKAYCPLTPEPERCRFEVLALLGISCHTRCSLDEDLDTSVICVISAAGVRLAFVAPGGSRSHDALTAIKAGQVRLPATPQARDGTERRRATRLALSLPIGVTWGTEEGGRRSYLLGQTKDVSPKGICFWIPRSLPVGQKLNLDMEVPQEANPQLMLRLQCSAKVVRTQPGPPTEGGFRVATRVMAFETPMIFRANPLGPA